MGWFLQSFLFCPEPLSLLLFSLPHHRTASSGIWPMRLWSAWLKDVHHVFFPWSSPPTWAGRADSLHLGSWSHPKSVSKLRVYKIPQQQWKSLKYSSELAGFTCKAWDVRDLCNAWQKIGFYKGFYKWKRALLNLSRYDTETTRHVSWGRVQLCATGHTSSCCQDWGLSWVHLIQCWCPWDVFILTSTWDCFWNHCKGSQSTMGGCKGGPLNTFLTDLITPSTAASSTLTSTYTLVRRQSPQPKEKKKRKKPPKKLTKKPQTKQTGNMNPIPNRAFLNTEPSPPDLPSLGLPPPAR